MKKLLAILLCVALLACAFTFVACDDKDGDSDNVNSTANGESMLEDFVGKLATYILENSDKLGNDDNYGTIEYAQMNFELPEKVDDIRSNYGVNWLLAYGYSRNNYTHQNIYLVGFDSAESANANLSAVQNYFFEGAGGTYYVEGSVVVWDSGDGSHYNEIKNTENKINDLLPENVISRYKYHITSLLSADDSATGYVSCVFLEGAIVSNSSIYASTASTRKSLVYLMDEQNEKAVEIFNSYAENDFDVEDGETIVVNKTEGNLYYCEVRYDETEE